MTLLTAADSKWAVEDGVAKLSPINDYFHRAAFLVRVDKPVTGHVWLSVEYLDKGLALISISPGAPHSKLRGIARLNSGKFRHAVVEYENAGFAKPIRIEGIEQLRSVALTDAAPPDEPLPPVSPPQAFRVPSQRVTTANADPRSLADLPETRAGMRNLLPLMRALGFNGIETYVRWGWIETKPGVYDWSLYDGVLEEIEKQGLQWFPMLLAGSGYALPEWLYESDQNVGFRCLEHGIIHDTQSIFYENQERYAKRFIQEFGKHYGSRKSLLGIRLGPSGDYGEAQYPARGPGYKFKRHHTHPGYWAGDEYAVKAFRQWAEKRYASIGELNQAWGDKFASFDEVKTFLPITAVSRRKRIDFAQWYMGAMSEWCEKWAVWAREAMPNTVIHQSSGGWGLVEVGTDFSYQARSMAKVKGGIRLTNESDDFADSFTITRMASSAARFYGAGLGYEPGGFGTARGIVGRLYNAITTGAEHLFYYNGNFDANDQGITKWVKYGPLMDRRSKPIIEVGVFYPDTANRLDDEVLRHRWGSPFMDMAMTFRSTLDYDYVSEQMIEDGALDRYKVIVFLWGHITEKHIVERLDRWVEAGGTLIYPQMPRGILETVEGDSSTYVKWSRGETGKGRMIPYLGNTRPAEYYAQFVRKELIKLGNLRPEILRALKIQKPWNVYWSVMGDGKLAWLNFDENPVTVRQEGGKVLSMEPYSIVME